MFKLLITYPSREQEIEIMNRFTEGLTLKTSKSIHFKNKGKMHIRIVKIKRLSRLSISRKSQLPLDLKRIPQKCYLLIRLSRCSNSVTRFMQMRRSKHMWQKWSMRPANPHRYNHKIDEHIEYRASPRAPLWLILAAKAHAVHKGRGYVKPEDVKSIVYDVLRHRIILTYEAEAEQVIATGLFPIFLKRSKSHDLVREQYEGKFIIRKKEKIL
jgi:MoxR-like ATPase